MEEFQAQHRELARRDGRNHRAIYYLESLYTKAIIRCLWHPDSTNFEQKCG